MKMYRLLIVVVVVILGAGCGPTAHVEKASHVNLNKYQTFAWAQRDVKPTRSSIAEQRIREAVTDELVRTQGWREVKRNPDVILSYDVLVQKSSHVQSDPIYSWGGYRTFYNPYNRRFYRVYYPQRLVGYDNYRVPTREGTITISIVDTKTDQIVVQGWATDEIDNRNMSAKEAQRIVKSIFKKWN